MSSNRTQETIGGMKSLLITVLVLAMIGCIGAGIYLFAQHQKEVEGGEQDQRDHSTPMWCANTARCYSDPQECQEHKLACVETTEYACYTAKSITKNRKAQWCLSSFGSCEEDRISIQRFREFTDVSACLVFRTHP